MRGFEIRKQKNLNENNKKEVGKEQVVNVIDR